MTRTWQLYALVVVTGLASAALSVRQGRPPHQADRNRRKPLAAAQARRSVGCGSRRTATRVLKSGGRAENRGGHGMPQKILLEELTSADFQVVEIHDDWSANDYGVVFRKPFKGTGPVIPGYRSSASASVHRPVPIAR